MPSTAKDILGEGTTAASPAKTEVPGSQPSAATSAEIPVTVHASRYSATSKGAGKLPPVHEETRTVIILPQGAVVRLSATVTPGELVVLTNTRTGADVICRVTNVKTQPGIQNYVHLEFTQRAPDFWEEASAAERGKSMSKPAVVAAPPPSPTPIAANPRHSSIQEAQTTPKVSMPAAEIKSAPTPLPEVTPLADLPARGSEDPVRALAADLEVSEVTPTPAFAHKPSPTLAARAPRLQSFEPAAHSKNTARTIFFAVAAVALLAIGLVGGSMWRRDRGAIVAPQPPNSPSTAAVPTLAPVAAAPETPIVNTSGKNNTLGPSASTEAKNLPPPTPSAQPAPVRTAVEPAKVEVEKQPVARANINIGKISAPRVKATAQLNSSEPPPVLPAIANALPGVISEGVGTAARPTALPSVQPAAPAPVKGGQLQQPKLLSSVAAVYPPLARAQHVQGDVVIDALIDATGKVTATNVLNGNPLLEKAAVDSLRLWKYQPATLNGEAIPFHMKVTITFHMN